MAGEELPKLSDREQRFVDEYLLALNASAAARVCGTPRKSAGQVGSQMLRRPHVRAVVDAELRKRRSNGNLIRRTLEEWMSLAYSDVFELCDQAPDTMQLIMKPLDEIPPEARRAVASITQKAFETDGEDAKQKGGGISLKLWNKPLALKEVTRILGIDQLPEGGTEMEEALATAGEFITGRLAQLRAARERARAMVGSPLCGGQAEGDQPAGSGPPASV